MSSESLDADTPLAPLLEQMQGLSSDARNVGEELIEHLAFVRFDELLHASSDADALTDALFARKSLSHKQLASFIRQGFSLPSVAVGARVCVCLPNIPELGSCLICLLATQRVVFPLNPAMTAAEMQWEIRHTRCEAVVVLDSATSSFPAVVAASALELPLLLLSPSTHTTGLFSISRPHPAGPHAQAHATSDTDDTDSIATPRGPVPGTSPRCAGAGPGALSELVLLLFTSGTSGRKKLVPYSLRMLVAGVACIISSWELRSSDTCLNMMPLFHIGGIMRNLLAPLLSGGASIVCNGFDPVIFWDILESYQVTWYYAAPTMHHSLLQESALRYGGTVHPPTSSVRFLANAAGGLLPVLAKSLKETFNATILTSYGMTECMPISTPPIATYDLDPSGTSGIAVGPRICIVMDDLEVAVEAGAELSALLPGQVGNILVKGGPCFSGYEVTGDGHAEDACFFTVDREPGWFCTGDCGYLNSDGYLFITGRSKEIINRGGETISPYEIEEAIIQHPQVSDVLAFAAPHETLQETVGVVVVTPPALPRLDWPSLCEYLEAQQQLHRSKWPSVIVFMGALPRNAANKLLRVKLGQRLNLEPLQDYNMSPLSRVFDGECPKQGTALTVPIPISTIKHSVHLDLDRIESFISDIEGVTSVAVTILDSPLRQDTIIAFVTPDDIDVAKITKLCQEQLHRYLCPLLVHACRSLDDSHGKSRVSDPATLAVQLSSIIKKESASRATAPSTAAEKSLEEIWRSELNLDPAIAISKDVSFFALGGDSLRAGQLVGAVRKQMQVPLTVADLFSFPTIESFAARVTELQQVKSRNEEEGFGNFDGDYLEDLEIESHLLDSAMSLLLPGSGKTVSSATVRGPAVPITKTSPDFSSSEELKTEGHDRSTFCGDDDPDVGADDRQQDYEYRMKYENTNITTLITQILPVGVFFPLRRIVMLFVIAWSWVIIMNQGIHRFPALLLAMVVARLVRGFVFPLVGVACKWIIIGRYKPGRYPLFGAMYLKWWVVEQILRIMGRGFFGDESFGFLDSSLTRWYYILMGAQIGQNVMIHSKAKLGQPDLLIIGDDVCIDEATVRPFGLEEGHMILLPIVVGEHCSIGVKSIVAPGAVIASNSHLGPLSSSHEVSDAAVNNKQYCRPSFPKPPVYLVLLLGVPVLVLVTLVSSIPWILGLKLMLSDAKSNGWYDHGG